MSKEPKPKTRLGKGQASKKSIRDVIEQKAYEIYEQRGKENGKALDDWLEAERIVIKKKS